MNAQAANFVEVLSSQTQHTPAFLHFDPIGLIRFGDTNSERLENFGWSLDQIRRLGGNVFVPAYSYSFTKNEVFDPIHTPSTLGKAVDYLRSRFPERRTLDGVFSYLAFSNQIDDRFFELHDVETFGKGSLIDWVFQRGGYLSSFGHRLHYNTEVHYLENLIGVPYRYNKDFHGQVRLPTGELKHQRVRYFCRRIELNLGVSFERLMQDLRSTQRVENWIASPGFEYEAVAMNQVLEHLQSKLQEDPTYLCILDFESGAAQVTAKENQS